MHWTQEKRPFRLETPLGTDTLLLVNWEGEEHVSSFFRYTVTAFSTKGDISAKDLLLKSVTLLLRLPDGSDRKIHGIVSRVTRGGSAPEGTVGYQLEIVPPHFALALDEGFDIFQNKSARDVCEELLKGTPHEWKLTRTLEPRPYCFRYRESRWNIIARLLEQEGIFFRYDHRGSEAKLVLGDSTASAAPAWGVDSLKFNQLNTKDSRLLELQVESQPYVAETRVRTASEFLFNKNVGNVEKASGKFSPPGDIKSYRFEQQMTAHRSGISHSGGLTASDAGKLPDDTKVYARLRQERAEALAVCFTGQSRYVGLESGAKTEVKDHPNDDMNGQLFVLSVRHRGGNGDYIAAYDDSAASYENEFIAIPAKTPFRPALTTAWPQVSGSHVGTVVGPAGEEIYTDKHGRVQVVFKWEREDSKELDHSCWIRVAQAFAGQQFGSVFLPRIGHEVLIEFLDGNPDNPVIVGSLYNGTNLPPWALPDHKTQSGIKTKSTLKGGTDNFNQVRFEDKKGSEHIDVQAEKDLITLVKNDETRKVGHNRTTTIHNADLKTVEEADDTTHVLKGKQVITVDDNDRQITVAKNQSVSIGIDQSIDIGRDQAETIGRDDTLTIGRDEKRDISRHESTSIGGNRSASIGRNNDVTVGSKESISIGADASLKIGGKYAIKVDGSAMTVESAMKIELKVGESSIVIDQSGVTIKGLKVQIDATVMAGVKGKAVQVDGSAMTMVKGGVVMIN